MTDPRAMAALRAQTGRAAVARLPPSVRVGAHDFTLLPLSIHEASGRRIWGRFEAAAQTIHLQQDMPTSAVAVDTILHEIGHAIWWAYGIQDDDKEERTVRTLATAWAQIFRDNPALIAWIAAWGTSDAE